MLTSQSTAVSWAQSHLGTNTERKIVSPDENINASFAFSKIVCVFLCVCMRGGYMHVGAGTSKGQRCQQPQELCLHGAVSHSVWVLRTKHEYSGRGCMILIFDPSLQFITASLSMTIWQYRGLDFQEPVSDVQKYYLDFLITMICLTDLGSCGRKNKENQLKGMKDYFGSNFQSLQSTVS